MQSCHFLNSLHLMKKNNRKSLSSSKLILKPLCLIAITVLSTLHLSAQDSDIDIISQRIQTVNKNVNVTSNDNNADTYLQSVKSDGSFADINYADKSATNWQPQTHLDRLKPIITAYTLPTSKFYSKEDVYNKIVSMLSYWHNANPKSTNWYMQEIACPQRMGVLLLIMRTGNTPLPSNLENMLIQRMESDGGDPITQVGANKMDVATHWIYRGCLTKDPAILRKGVDEAFAPLYLTTEEGFQHDYSYQQHGSQLYLGGYGRVLVDGISKLALYTVNTSYALSGETLKIMSKFIRETYIPIIRGNYLLFNTLGRGVTRKNALNETNFTNILNRMITLDPQYEDFYAKTVERLKGTQNANYNLADSHTAYWRSDYSLHQRPNYTMDVRMSSIYTSRNENGNGENLKGYFLVDGATSITQKGNEYVDIFPVWDWAKIPGTTTPAKTTIPKTAAWQVNGNSYFAGGITDGKYGISAYLYDDRDYDINTKAKKSWFFFDKEVICLGSGITSTAEESINTTVNQTLLRGDVKVITNGGSETILNKGEHSFTNLSWILHDGIAYYFPQQANLEITNQAQSGTWNSINTTQTSELITKDVFKTWFNHGIKPNKGSYSYIVVPNISTTDDIKNYSVSDIEILANTDSLQVVKHKNLNIIGLVFFKGATFTSEEISIQADKACVMMIKEMGSENVDIYISDPSKRNSKISLIAQLANISGKKHVVCTLPTYPDPYAGSTFKYTIDKNTPSYNSKVEYIYPMGDAYVRSGLYGYTNYGSDKSLVVKKSDGDYGRESFIKFNLQEIDTESILQNLSNKIYLSLSVASANTGIYGTNWNISIVENNSWEETTINWNNRPQEQELIVSAQSSYTGTEFKADITEYVLANLLDGNKTISFCISATDDGNTTDASFYSKEAGIQTSPRLIIERIDNTSGIDNEKQKGSAPTLNLYPNPAEKGMNIYIDVNSDDDLYNNFEVKVFNLQGQIIYTTNENIIKTDKFSSGVYFVLLKDINGTMHHGRFIVK